MLVSRPEVNCEYVVDFPVVDRFIKLPIEKYLEVEGIDAIAPQVALINAINDPQYRFVTAVLSRRTGKTYIGNVIAFLKLLEPGSQVLIIAPNYSLAQISWNEQLKRIKDHGLEMTRCNAKDKELVLENGSLLKLGSVGNADSCVGRSYDLVLFDEAAIDDRGGSAFNVTLMPTLDKPNSKAIFISTPRGTNWMFDFYENGFATGAEYAAWCSIFGTYKDNPRVPKKVIDQARAAMSTPEFLQEFECSFSTREGQIYEAFDQDKHIQDLSGKDFSNMVQFEGLMGIDPGYKDPTAVVALKYDFDEDVFYLVEEYEEAMKPTGYHAEHIQRMIDDHEIDIITVDSAAAQFMQDLITDYDIPSNKAKKSVLDGISYVQMLIEQDKLIVSDKCVKIIDMLVNYRWDIKENLVRERPLHDKFSHLADAVRYAVYSYTR